MKPHIPDNKQCRALLTTRQPQINRSSWQMSSCHSFSHYLNILTPCEADMHTPQDKHYIFTHYNGLLQSMVTINNTEMFFYDLSQSLFLMDASNWIKYKIPTEFKV